MSLDVDLSVVHLPRNAQKTRAATSRVSLLTYVLLVCHKYPISLIDLVGGHVAARISKAEQYQKTRRILLDVARELFTEHGYTHTSTEEVVRRAGVTRGALYYHYRD